MYGDEGVCKVMVMDPWLWWAFSAEGEGGGCMVMVGAAW